MGRSKLKLYRYEPNEEIRLKTLRDRKLWFAKPKTFNDLYDCKLRFNSVADLAWSSASVEKAARILYPDITTLGSNFPLTEEMAKRLLTNLTRPRDGELENTLRCVSDSSQLSSLTANSVKACCFFSAEPLDSLMWAHYGANHKGFCVEYEVEGDPLDLHEVIYASRAPSVTVTELLFSPSETMVRVLTTKEMQWSHEREYRLLAFGARQNQAQDGEALDFPPWLKPKRILCGARVLDWLDDVRYGVKEQEREDAFPFLELAKTANILNCELVSVRPGSSGLTLRSAPTNEFDDEGWVVKRA